MDRILRRRERAAIRLPGLWPRFALAALAVAVGSVTPAAAQTGSSARSSPGLLVPLPAGNPNAAPGEWIEWHNNYPDIRAVISEQIGVATAAAWDTQLQSVLAIIRASPALADLRGFYPGPSGSIGESGGPDDFKRFARDKIPLGGRLHIIVWEPNMVERKPSGSGYRVKASWAYNLPGGFGAILNWLPELDASYTLEDERGKFYEEPPTTMEFSGFPVIGGDLVITRAGKAPIVAPVSQQRALRAGIKEVRGQADADAQMLASNRRHYEQYMSPASVAKRQKEIEEAVALEKNPADAANARKREEARFRRYEEDRRRTANPGPDDQIFRAGNRLKELEAQLAAMTDADRQAQAWHRRVEGSVSQFGELVTPGTPGARPMVEINRDFFDMSLPRTAIQVMIVPGIADRVTHQREDPSDIQRRVTVAIVEQTDWRKVAALMK